MAARAIVVARVDSETVMECSSEGFDTRNGILESRRCNRVERNTQWSSEATDREEKAAVKIRLAA